LRIHHPKDERSVRMDSLWYRPDFNSLRIAGYSRESAGLTESGTGYHSGQSSDDP
jgi:hypothetical protein